MKSTKRSIAIIGVGPRGAYALERYVLELCKRNLLSDIHIFLFDSYGKFGYGPIYDLDQKDSNWLNISERILDLEERSSAQNNGMCFPPFPSYVKWAGKDFNSASDEEVDYYPPRSKLGRYLKERFQSMLYPLEKYDLVTVLPKQVIGVSSECRYLTIECSDGYTYGNINEVLLTIGHQPTLDCTQIKKWKNFKFKTRDIQLHSSPYPVKSYINSGINYNRSIGIRGFGLAMIDVMRGIAEEVGGFTLIDARSRKFSYSTSYDIKNLIVPFSLDGKPPVPKPLSKKIDDWFKPTEEQLKIFKHTIGDRSTQEYATDFKFIIKAIAPLAAKVYSDLGNSDFLKPLTEESIIGLIISWLEDEKFHHCTMIDNDRSCYSIMNSYVEMALGFQTPSLDYCIGQVWRHCQPSIYENLSFSNCSDEIVVSIIELDERMKRYAFGPPVDSIQYLLALVDAEVLSLEWIEDPTIELTKAGWKLSSESESIVLELMINSVLDSPIVEKLESPILDNLLAHNYIKAVSDDLGIITDDNGFITSEENPNLLIAILGRLAKGTVIGVDAILECYGERPQAWAAKAVDNHEKFLNNKSFT